VLLILGSVSLAYFQLVVLKMLPFDNKSEFQIIVDMPVGTPVEETARVLQEIGAEVAKVPEVTNYQAYAGTASPINFNGLVRQYYLRSTPEKGDIQVNLVDKHSVRGRATKLPLGVRDAVEAIGSATAAIAKVVEVPPGPPVMSPIVAEIYGPDYAGQIAVGKQVRQAFEKPPTLLRSTTISMPIPQIRAARAAGQGRATGRGAERHRRGGRHGAGRHGRDAGTQCRFQVRVPVRVTLPAEQKSTLDALLKLRVRSRDGQLVPVSELVEVRDTVREKTIYHKDLLPVVYVVGDMGGALDSPLYGMFDIRSQINGMAGSRKAARWANGSSASRRSLRRLQRQVGRRMAGHLRDLPRHGPGLRGRADPDLSAGGRALRQLSGAAGHHGADSADHHRRHARPRAVRRAIHGDLDDRHDRAGRHHRPQLDPAGRFHQAAGAAGMDFHDAVIQSAAVRAKPIALTALAAMLGALFILDDPIFNGLALSLIFGILVSTLLTLVVIPVLYYAAFRKEHIMTIERIIRIMAGFFVMLSLALGWQGSPVFVSEWFLAFTAFVGFNLFQSGFTGFCPPEKLLKKLGVNSVRRVFSLEAGIDDGLQNVFRADEIAVLDIGQPGFQFDVEVADARQVLDGVSQRAHTMRIAQAGDLE
jgi:hypothetical protein